MEKYETKTNCRKGLYKIYKPFKSGFLKVSNIHTIYWEASGNPLGKPVKVLHGGPGLGLASFMYGFFDPSFYHIVQSDQRSSGKSTPFGSLTENTTWDIVEDIEKLRTFLEIEKWHTILGGCWGSLLGLAYTQTYNTKVGCLVIASVLVATPIETDFFFQNGINYLFSDHYESFIENVSEGEFKDILNAYWLGLNSNDKMESLKYTYALNNWYENQISRIGENVTNFDKKQSSVYVFLARLNIHYLINGFFIRNNQIFENLYMLEDIPTEIISCRYDGMAFLKVGYKIHKKLKKSNIHIIQNSGHRLGHPEIIEEIIKITNKYKN